MVEKFRFRWNNYKNNDRNYQEYGTCMQQHLFEHVSITMIDKTDPSNLLQRKNYCRSILKAMTLQGLNVEECVRNSVLRYSYQWISTDCNKELIYGKRFWYQLLLLLFLSLSLLWPFLLLYCFYYDDLCDYVSILIIIIINIVIKITTIIISFMTLLLLLLLLHHCFISFNIYYISSLFSILSLLLLHHYHCYCFIIALFSLSLLFLVLLHVIFYYYYHYYYMSIVIIIIISDRIIITIIIIVLIILLLPILHHYVILFYSILVSLSLGSH